ncbi:glycine/D-amino acid oxidase-like deaminating enzyme [Rhizobium sp. BK650]|nr:glycine/D-amino acid oxidase-like deaminating enzyme [Rhizobium sp. BK650]
MGVTEPLPHHILPVVGVWAHDHGGGYLRQVERGNIVFGGGAERTDVSLDTGYAKADPARLPGQLRSLLPTPVAKRGRRDMHLVRLRGL